MPIDKTAKQMIAEAVKDTRMSDKLIVAVEKYIDINETDFQLIDCRYEDFSKDRLGFSSSYMKFEISLKKFDAYEPRTVAFFVKSQLYSFEEMINAVSEGGYFIKESNFYKNIVPLFEKNCKTEKWHATCYFANENVLVMEDLRCQGYRLFSRMADDMVEFKSALAALARLHSCSIITEDRLSRNTEKAGTLKELYPDLLDEGMFEQDSIISKWCSVGVDLACVIAKYLNYDHVKIRRSYEPMQDLVKPSKIHRNVVCHGDLWGNNLMFRDGYPAVRECILLDFQIIRYAPLAIDLLQFLHLNATRNFRDKHVKELVEFYRCSLEETIRSNDSSARAPELADIFAAMEDLRIVGLFMAVIYLPISLMDPNVITEYTKDVNAFWNFMFCNRTEQILAHMEVNETYKSRIQEAVIELAEYIDTMSEAK